MKFFWWKICKNEKNVELEKCRFRKRRQRMWLKMWSIVYPPNIPIFHYSILSGNRVVKDTLKSIYVTCYNWCYAKFISNSEYLYISTCHFERSEKSCQSIAKISLPAFSRIRNDNDSEYEFFKAVTFIVFLRKLSFINSFVHYKYKSLSFLNLFLCVTSVNNKNYS